MFAVTVEIDVAPGALDALMPLLHANARASRAEPGCLRFDVLTDPERPGEVFLYELYGEAADFEAHLLTEHYRRFETEAGHLIRAKRVGSWAEVGGAEA